MRTTAVPFKTEATDVAADKGQIDSAVKDLNGFIDEHGHVVQLVTLLELDQSPEDVILETEDPLSLASPFSCVPVSICKAEACKPCKPCKPCNNTLEVPDLKGITRFVL